MTDTLAENLGDIVKLGVSVQSISKNGHSYQVHTSDGALEADIVIAATPAYASAAMVKDLDSRL
jgi:monoamine oxidase